jgi:TatD DNase family protein
MLVDSHCHLDFPDFQSRLSEVLSAAREAGVGRMVTISTHVARFDAYRALTEAHESVFCTVGTHPHNAAAEPDVPVERLIELSRHPRCIAIGEAGLDYHYDKSPRDVQQRVFRTHIEAARETGLPLVIHARNADEDMISILSEEMRRGRFDAVLHCFSSGEKLAQAGVELGLYVSFSGILTFRNSEEIRRIAAAVPHDRLLVETDAPYLAPIPHRGKTNEPAYVAHTAHMLAEVIGVTDVTAAALTTANFYRLFAKAATADAEFRQALAS